MTLTAPLLAADLRTTYPRDTRAMADAELEALLRIEERALRSQFGVSGENADTDEILVDAMLAAWPSFLQQVHQKASEDLGADGYRVVFNRAGVIDFVFPAFVARMLASVADPDAILGGGALTTELVR